MPYVSTIQRCSVFPWHHCFHEKYLRSSGTPDNKSQGEHLLHYDSSLMDATKTRILKFMSHMNDTEDMIKITCSQINVAKMTMLIEYNNTCLHLSDLCLCIHIYVCILYIKINKYFCCYRNDSKPNTKRFFLFAPKRKKKKKWYYLGIGLVYFCKVLCEVRRE